MTFLRAHMCVSVCVCPFKLWKQLTDFHKTLYEHNGIGGHSTAVFHISYHAQKKCGGCSNLWGSVLQLPLASKSWNYIWKGILTEVFLWNILNFWFHVLSFNHKLKKTFYILHKHTYKLHMKSYFFLYPPVLIRLWSYDFKIWNTVCKLTNTNVLVVWKFDVKFSVFIKFIQVIFI